MRPPMWRVAARYAIVLIAGTDPLKDRKYDIAALQGGTRSSPGHEGAIFERPFDFADYMERRCIRK